jgi:hypothetical protein
MNRILLNLLVGVIIIDLISTGRFHAIVLAGVLAMAYPGYLYILDSMN